MPIDEEIRKLREGLYRLFDKRFTSRGFNIHSYLGDEGYSMTYLGSEYDMDFNYENNLKFSLKVKPKRISKKLEQRIQEARISNTQLNLTEYLASQKITIDNNIVQVSCRIKKIPKNETQINEVCEHLWGEIIKNIMLCTLNSE